MHVFLFDIDGTLVLSGGAGKAAMEAALRSAFGTKSGTTGIPFSGRTDRAILRDLFRRHGIEESAENAQRFLTVYLQHLPGCLSRHRGEILPGVAALLEQLHAHTHVMLGLLTGNVREGARLKLGHFGLFHYFRFGGYGDRHLHRDDVAREALGELRSHHGGDVAGERIWVIGDTPLDVQCARAIGARAAAVATGWHPREELAASKPDLLLNDFSDPEPLLACLNPAHR
jgi:phosphoglycolate phosphatase-like HAD superfamily hydrolase